MMRPFMVSSWMKTGLLSERKETLRIVDFRHSGRRGIEERPFRFRRIDLAQGHQGLFLLRRQRLADPGEGRGVEPGEIAVEFAVAF